MTIFDLLFLASFLVSVITLAAAAYVAMRGRVPRAFSILRVWLVCAALYLGVSVAVAYAAPQRVIAAGEPWCFDDWCLTVEKVHTRTRFTMSTSRFRVLRSASPSGPTELGSTCGMRTIAITTRARFRGGPLDVLLQPGESVAAKRSFQVPADVHELGLVTGHGGPPAA